MGGGGLPGKFLIVQSKILQNVKCILSREIRQGERLNKVVTVLSSNFALRKILNVEKQCIYKVFETKRSEIYLQLFELL
jgi:hypothetical protein